MNCDYGGIYDNEIKIASYTPHNISIYPYNIRNSSDFMLISRNDKLYYSFSVFDGRSEYISIYSKPDINDKESILELSHILRYKYDTVANMVFDGVLRAKCYYPVHITQHLIGYTENSKNLGYDVINGRIDIMSISVKVDGSIIKCDSRLPKIFHSLTNERKYISDEEYDKITYEIIHTIIATEPSTSKKAANF